MKRGFTLAEVLITLGIIGVVAAMTIPNLMIHLRNKKLESQFKKTYAELNIAARTFYAQEDSSVHDADVVLYGGSNSASSSTKLLANFMKYYKGYTMSRHWDSFDSSKKITQQNLNGEAITTSYPCDQSPVAIDMVGRLYAMDDTSTFYRNSKNFGPKICVDTNGTNKPNRLGYDRFVFVFTENNAVVPYTGAGWSVLDDNMTNDTSIAKYCSHSLKTPAHTCAYFALKNISPDGNGTYWGDFLK